MAIFAAVMVARYHRVLQSYSETDADFVRPIIPALRPEMAVQANHPETVNMAYCSLSITHGHMFRASGATMAI